VRIRRARTRIIDKPINLCYELIEIAHGGSNTNHHAPSAAVTEKISMPSCPPIDHSTRPSTSLPSLPVADFDLLNFFHPVVIILRDLVVPARCGAAVM